MKLRSLRFATISRSVVALLGATAIATGFAVATAAPAQAESTIGGTISPTEVLARAVYWYNQGSSITYNQGATHPDVDGTTYRTDCSGFVSMALHITPSGSSAPDTDALATSTYTTLIAANPSSSTDLRPGDLLDNRVGAHADHHVILFEAWQADHVHFTYYSFGSTPIAHGTATFSQSSLSGHPTTDYEAYRYKKIRNMTPTDYDADSQSDLALYRGSTGTWFLRTTFNTAITGTSSVYGNEGDIPVPGDYNGDGETDLALYRPSDATWWLHTTGGSAITGSGTTWGVPGDIPVPGDYNGDGKADQAVYRPSNNTWYLRTTSGTSITGTDTVMGAAGDVPVPGDYNGDGKADLALWNPSTGVWLIRSTSGATLTGNGVSWGLAGDIPVPGDYNGDGSYDLALWRPSTGMWYLHTTSNVAISGTSTSWGLEGDIPVPGDYNGDGKFDLAVWRPSTGVWYLRTTADNDISGTGTVYGVPGDTPPASLAYFNTPSGGGCGAGPNQCTF